MIIRNDSAFFISGKLQIASRNLHTGIEIILEDYRKY